VSAWEEQAMPVLRALEDPRDHNLKDGFLSIERGEGGRTLGLEMEDGALVETLFQLRDLGYVVFTDPEYFGSGASFTDVRITGRGLQVLGQWPRFEAMVSPSTLAEAVDRLGEFAPDDEQRTVFRRVAAYLRDKSAGTLRTTAMLSARSSYATLSACPSEVDVTLRHPRAKAQRGVQNFIRLTKSPYSRDRSVSSLSGLLARRTRLPTLGTAAVVQRAIAPMAAPRFRSDMAFRLTARLSPPRTPDRGSVRIGGLVAGLWARVRTRGRPAASSGGRQRALRAPCRRRLEPIRLHDLRHSYASAALAAGVHVKVVSEQLGHSTVALTLDTYSHVIPALAEDAAERVAALLDTAG
jgi:hypothetical protein